MDCFCHLPGFGRGPAQLQRQTKVEQCKFGPRKYSFLICTYSHKKEFSLHTHELILLLQLQPGIPLRHIGVTSATAKDYQFELRDFYGDHIAHVLVGDGAFLVPDDTGQGGKQQFFR